MTMNTANIKVSHEVGQRMDADSQFEDFIAECIERFARRDFGDAESTAGDKAVIDEAIAAGAPITGLYGDVVVTHRKVGDRCTIEVGYTHEL